MVKKGVTIRQRLFIDEKTGFSITSNFVVVAV